MTEAERSANKTIAKSNEDCRKKCSERGQQQLRAD
jgi:hypothetical protein